MKKFIISLFALLFLLASVGAYAAPDQESKELVEKAVQIFGEKGKDYALKVVGASAGPLRKDGGLYVFSFAFDGTGLAHPVNRNLVSQQWDLKDKNGKYIYSRLCPGRQRAGSRLVRGLLEQTGRNQAAAQENLHYAGSW